VFGHFSRNSVYNYEKIKKYIILLLLIIITDRCSSPSVREVNVIVNLSWQFKWWVSNMMMMMMMMSANGPQRPVNSI